MVRTGGRSEVPVSDLRGHFLTGRQSAYASIDRRMKARPCRVGFGQSESQRLCDSNIEQACEIIGVFCFLFGAHQVAILLTKTRTPTGRIRHAESGVGRVTIKRVAAILWAFKAELRLQSGMRCLGLERPGSTEKFARPSRLFAPDP